MEGVYFQSNTSAVWTNQMSCTSGSWSASLSESLLSTDGSKIFSFFTYQSPRKMYFAIFNKADGAVIGSRYKSSTTITGIYGSVQKGDLIVLTVYYSSTYYLAMLNTTSNVLVTKQFSGAGLFGAAVQPYDAG